MKNRNIKILLISVIILSTFTYIINSKIDEQNQEKFRLFIPSLKQSINDINQINIRKTNNEQILLEKINDHWKVSGKWEYPANYQLINKLLISLVEAKIIEEKTSDQRLYNRLGVEDLSLDNNDSTEITFKGEGIKYTIIYGHTNQNKNRYVRISGTTASWLIDQNPDIPEDTTNWLNKTITDIDSSKIMQVMIPQLDKSNIIIKKESEESADFKIDNVPLDRELSYPTIINSVGSFLSNLELEDIRPATENAQLIFTEFQTFKGLTIKVKLMPKENENWISISFEKKEGYKPELEKIKIPSNEWEYKISEYKANLLNKSMEDFLEPLIE